MLIELLWIGEENVFHFTQNGTKAFGMTVICENDIIKKGAK